MEHIIDIAKEDLDTYNAELASVGVLYELKKSDYEKALRNINQLREEIMSFLI